MPYISTFYLSLINSVNLYQKLGKVKYIISVSTIKKSSSHISLNLYNV